MCIRDSYASEHQKLATIGNEQSLIVDPGSRTFDWLVARGMRFVQKQSYSFNRGMSDVLRLLADVYKRQDDGIAGSRPALQGQVTTATPFAPRWSGARRPSGNCS